MGMTHDRKDLRPGDVVEGTGHVLQDGTIAWITDDIMVVTPAVHEGDQVEWSIGSKVLKGEILAVHYSSGLTWAFLKVDGSAEPIVRPASDLTRREPG